MPWVVNIGDEFGPELLNFPRAVRVELLALTAILEIYGPLAGRPYVDTLKGSRHANMKELRFAAAGGEWRVAFAFDPKREAILLDRR